ncbi:TssA family type VI secretion system protein [Variovorax ginsengisoli]|uniref:TssA family type VI secretion system protein n=1 Tax=Variovorax ginsengisoli TaxID=363844 RepID=A0ABT8S8N8_9BURK|nr:TssA family type VI secretion system protein [Variovorax ginsengisoli]MDN8616091.1 TssA family type VI secretion system protein [Variovorax ginsengisoli]MDO1535261.1 TssA family type VI secretion system protein [Variovorax ginsengisoli]
MRCRWRRSGTEPSGRPGQSNSRRNETWIRFVGRHRTAARQCRAARGQRGARRPALRGPASRDRNPGADGQTDWQRVGQLASLLLADKGKDLLVASYLGGALLQGEGLPGLAMGLQVVGDMVEHFWDGMYPPLARMRARRNAIEWLLDRAELAAEERHWIELDPQPPALVAALRAGARRLDDQLRAKDAEGPSMQKLLSLVDRIPVAEEAPTVAAVVAEETAAPTPEVRSAPTPAPPLALAALAASTGDVAVALGLAFDHLNHLVDAMMAADIRDARAYRASRFANWGGLDALPPADDGRTKIAPPVAQVVETLQRLQEEDPQPQDAIFFAEAQLPAFPFWLDLQALCAAGLARLGEGGAAARGEVERATRATCSNACRDWSRRRSPTACHSPIHARSNGSARSAGRLPPQAARPRPGTTPCAP